MKEVNDELMTPGCPQCAVKHLSAALYHRAHLAGGGEDLRPDPYMVCVCTAYINLVEVRTGYFSHLWYAVGALVRAEEHFAVGLGECVAREARLMLEQYGEDSLIESAADVVELVDLKFGACRFIVAEPQGASERTAEHYRKLGSIRVATKYPRIARAHFERRGTQVEIVQLHGNIELGPLTGMSECIVDITATGTTLRENNLEITDEVLDSTARFFANTESFRTDARVRELASNLRDQSRNRDLKVTAGGAGK